MSERPTLAEFICRHQHEFEWRPLTGTHSAPTRREACTDCADAAALAVEWADSQRDADRATLSASIRARFLQRFPDLRLPEVEAS